MDRTENTHILITGATGFIGRRLCKKLEAHPSLKLFYLLRPESEGMGIQEDLCFRHSPLEPGLVQFMREKKIRGVIHLASVFLSTHESKDLRRLLLSNVCLPTEILEAGRNSGLQWFLNTGTFWQHYEGKKYSPVNLYAATKQAFEDLATYYREACGISVVHLKLNDTYGPEDTRKKLFQLWVQAIRTRTPLSMSKGEQIMDILHVDDVVAGYEQLIQALLSNHRSLANQTFALHSKERMTLKNLGSLFGKLSGPALKIKWGQRPYRPREVMKPWKGGRSVPGWKPQIGLTKGISDLLAQIRKPKLP